MTLTVAFSCRMSVENDLDFCFWICCAWGLGLMGCNVLGHQNVSFCAQNEIRLASGHTAAGTFPQKHSTGHLQSTHSFSWGTFSDLLTPVKNSFWTVSVSVSLLIVPPLIVLVSVSLLIDFVSASLSTVQMTAFLWTRIWTSWRLSLCGQWRCGFFLHF